MMIQAVLGNPNHPEYGVATIPLPIPHDQYAHCMELLEALEIGDAIKVDCKVEEVDSFFSVLKRTEMLTVNEGEACSVDKVIELPAQRFKQFSRALLADYDFIAENKNAIRHDDDARHCLLILDAEGTDGFLVDPQGYNYARYSAFVPNARSLLTPDMGIERSYLSPAEP